MAQFIIKNHTQCQTLSRLQELQVGAAGARGGLAKPAVPAHGAAAAASAAACALWLCVRPLSLHGPALPNAHLPGVSPHQAQTRGTGLAVRTLPELAIAMRSADAMSGSDSDSDSKEDSGAPGGQGSALGGPSGGVGGAFAT